MRYYSVHAPVDEPDSPERYIFVKDGFSWPALLVPILWILWHRLWLTLVYYIVFVLVVAWTGRLLGDGAATTLGAIGLILFALEANNIRRLSLESSGWREAGTGFGRNLEEAEARFFGAGAEGIARKEAVIARAAYTPQHRPQIADESIIGLFPEPER
jgi:hypothetical protein